MPTYQKSAFSLEVAQNYFAQLNPLAMKIAKDIEETKLAYGQLWHQLQPTEHNDIINETLISPEIYLRYFENLAHTTKTTKTNSTSSSSSSSSLISRLSYVTTSVDSSSLRYSQKDSFATPRFKVQLKGADSNSRRSDNESNINNINKNAFFQNPSTHFKIQITANDEATVGLLAGEYEEDGELEEEVVDRATNLCDEHSSAPFSYKTCSQINLHMFADISPRDVVQTLITKYQQHKQCNDYKKELQTARPMNRSENTRNLPGIHNTNITIENPTAEISQKQKQSSNVCTTIKPTSDIDNALSYVAYSAQAYYANNDEAGEGEEMEEEENAKLMPNYNKNNNSNIVTALSSTNLILDLNTCTYDDFELSGDDVANAVNDDDNSILCENVKLLDTFTSFRKGFEFLNNW